MYEKRFNPSQMKSDSLYCKINKPRAVRGAEYSPAIALSQEKDKKEEITGQTRTIRGSDYSPAIALSEVKDIL